MPTKQATKRKMAFGSWQTPFYFLRIADSLMVDELWLSGSLRGNPHMRGVILAILCGFA